MGGGGIVELDLQSLKMRTDGVRAGPRKLHVLKGYRFERRL